MRVVAAEIVKDHRQVAIEELVDVAGIAGRSSVTASSVAAIAYLLEFVSEGPFTYVAVCRIVEVFLISFC